MSDIPGTGLALYTPHQQVELSKGVWTYAEAIASTDFVPKALRGNPPAVMACMMKGTEVGLPLMASLSAIHVIEGRPTMSAESMRAVVIARGHKIWVEESSSVRCTVGGRRQGDDRDSRFTFTIDDARAAGLLGKEVWKRYAAAMLLARATAMLCRAVFPDCLAGLSYTREELEAGFAPDDYGTDIVDAVAVEAEQPPKRTAQAKRTATRGAARTTPDAPVEDRTASQQRPPAPPLPGEEDDIIDADVIEDDLPGRDHEPEPVQDPEPYEQGDGPRMTGPQMIAMLLTRHGVTARADKIRAVHQIIGRPIESTKDLTMDETSMILAVLNALGDGELFPFDDEPVAESEAEAVELPLEDAPAPAASATKDRRAAVSDPEDWDADRWRQFIQARKKKPTQVMPEFRRIASESGVTIATLDDIAGSGVAGMLVGWLEDNA
ncbi:MAG TPA: hypothetical protein PLV68_05495 [Ilumatobacteraceae bacterium]|nr:hypothetical protein [Ilumatobacteraceae bacterium]